MGETQPARYDPAMTKPLERLRPILPAVTVLSVILFLYATASGDGTLRLWTKPWPVLCLAAWVHLSAAHTYGKWIRNGLLASVVGDICLEFDGGFLLGMGAFLLAHLFYLAAFCRAEGRLRAWRGLPFLFWGIGLLFWLRSGLEAAGMLIPVAVYTTVICAMLWRASARLDDRAGPEERSAALGALLFGLSDSLIAVSRFGSEEISWAPYAIILLYWLGQWGIASSARKPA